MPSKTDCGIAANSACIATRFETCPGSQGHASFNGIVWTISDTTNVRQKEQKPPDAYHKMALERMAQGYHLYTFVVQGRLLHYGWLIERQVRGVDGWVDQTYFPPQDTAVLFDHFTHPSARGRGLYFQALCQLLHDARDLAEPRQAHVTVFGSNAPSRHVIEKVGFQHEGSLYKERRLVWSRRYAVAARGEFRTALL
jgi:RimJ/RimL family protein N-acetyltransferase